MRVFQLFDTVRQLARDTNLSGAFSNNDLLQIYPLVATDLRRRIARHGVNAGSDTKSFLVQANSSTLSFGYGNPAMSSMSVVESRRVSSYTTIQAVQVAQDGSVEFTCAQPHGLALGTAAEVVLCGIAGIDADGAFSVTPTGANGFSVPGLLSEQQADGYVADSGRALVPSTASYARMYPATRASGLVVVGASTGGDDTSYLVRNGRMEFRPVTFNREFRVGGVWPFAETAGLNGVVPDELWTPLAHLVLGTACQEIDEAAHTRNMAIALGPGWMVGQPGGMLLDIVGAKLKAANAQAVLREHPGGEWPYSQPPWVGVA